MRFYCQIFLVIIFISRKIIQGIRRIENDKILKEIEDYIFDKNKKLNKKIGKVTKDIIKKNINIAMK